jgi:hypothetical protein
VESTHAEIGVRSREAVAEPLVEVIASMRTKRSRFSSSFGLKLNDRVPGTNFEES